MSEKKWIQKFGYWIIEFWLLNYWNYTCTPSLFDAIAIDKKSIGATLAATVKSLLGDVTQLDYVLYCSLIYFEEEKFCNIFQFNLCC